MLACVCGMVYLNITHSAKVLLSYPEQIMTDINVKLILKNIQREVSVVRSTSCSSRETRLNSQRPHGVQLYETPFPEDLTLSSCPCGFQTQTPQRHTCRLKHTYTINKFLKTIFKDISLDNHFKEYNFYVHVIVCSLGIIISKYILKTELI